MLTSFEIVKLNGQCSDMQTNMRYKNMDKSSNETKDIMYGYVIYLIKPKVKNLIFPVQTL